MLATDAEDNLKWIAAEQTFHRASFMQVTHLIYIMALIEFYIVPSGL
jgi:hypothetical protein